MAVRGFTAQLNPLIYNPFLADKKKDLTLWQSKFHLYDSHSAGRVDLEMT